MTASPIRVGVALLAILSLAPVPAAAGSFKHLASVYQDDKEGPLRAPEGVACDEKGAIVVADTGNGRLLTFAWRDGKVSGGAELRVAEAPYPVRVQIDGRGNVLVLDRKARRIVRLDASGKFDGVVEPRGVSGSGSVGVSAFRVTKDGELVLLDVASHRILVLDSGGKVTRELALPPSGPQFMDVAVDASGRILALDAAGSRLWAAEKGARELQPLGVSLKDRASFPVYVAEESGRFLVVDQFGNGVVTLGGDGTFQGRELEMGWADGRVYYPAQACTAIPGVVVLADRANDRIQVFATGR